MIEALTVDVLVDEAGGYYGRATFDGARHYVTGPWTTVDALLHDIARARVEVSALDKTSAPRTAP